MFKNTKTRRGLRPITLLLSFLLAAGGWLSATAATEPDKAAIAAEVRKEVQRLIEQEGILDAAIERGITRYIRKQQQLAKAQKANKRVEHARKLRPVSADRDHIFGNPAAEITLVEYSDFECPFCKRYHPTVKKLIGNNDGRVNWVYRHFPLAFHNPGARKQAEASECVAELGGNDAFWQFGDRIYQRTRSNGNGFPLDRLAPLAQEVGVDPKAFNECMESGRMASRVDEDYQDGVKAGINGTPGTILVNHKTGKVLPLSGAVPVQRLQAAVDRLAADAGKGE